MRDLLIIYPKPHHVNLIEGECGCLNSQGFKADALLFNSNRIEFLSSNLGKLPFVLHLIALLDNYYYTRATLIRLGVREFLIDIFFNEIFKRYKIVEFCGNYEYKVLELARKAKCMNKHVVTRLWDHFHADWHEDLFMLSDVINVGNVLMKKDFISIYPQFEDKTVMVSYGLSQVELLNDIMDGKVNPDLSFLSKEAQGKIVVTIGYSGRAWHQHFYIIDAIEKLPIEMKNKLFLLLPMTYSNEMHYTGYLYDRLNKSKITFQILTERLPLLQNLSMRMISDVVINWQVDDALSASISEHLMAGSVLIAGNWLPYKLFRDYGAYLHDTTFENLSTTILKVLNNLKEEKEKCKVNRQILYTFSSWKFKGEASLNLYKKVLTPNS